MRILIGPIFSIACPEIHRRLSDLFENEKKIPKNFLQIQESAELIPFGDHPRTSRTEINKNMIAALCG